MLGTPRLGDGKSRGRWAAVGWLAISWVGAASATTYYVDCEGHDDRSGTGPAEAWQSLSKASQAALGPGDHLLLKRGCAWTGPLVLGGSGTAAAAIRLGAYGAGADPEIHDGNPANVVLKGRWWVVESLSVRSRPVATDPGCRDQPVGSRSGIEFAAGAMDNTARYISSSGHSMGVWMAAGSKRNRLLRSLIKDNTSMTVNDAARPDNDAGAFGVLINGDSNEVAWNTLSNNLAWCSYDYGIDGSSVEIYDAKGNRIHHNRSLEEGTFTELGGARTDDNVFAWNLVSSSAEACIFLNVRGAGSKWGPNLRTVAAHNTVYLTGAKSQGIVCGGGCSPEVLTLTGNILWAGWKAAYVDGQPREDHNLYWKAGGGPLIQNLVLDATSRKADPRFADAAHGDFRLAADSPALDAGDEAALAYGGGLDLDGTRVPGGSGPDLGCFERGGLTGLWGKGKLPELKPGTGFAPGARVWSVRAGSRVVDALGSRR